MTRAVGSKLIKLILEFIGAKEVPCDHPACRNGAWPDGHDCSLCYGNGFTLKSKDMR